MRVWCEYRGVTFTANCKYHIRVSFERERRRSGINMYLPAVLPCKLDAAELAPPEQSALIVRDERVVADASFYERLVCRGEACYRFR